MNDIDQMQAGQELNDRIATGVMWWTLDPGEGGWHTPAGFRPVSEFDPSTNIAHAWEVVEKMAVDGFIPRIGNHGAGHWWVTVQFQQGAIQHTASANTAPLAICRAALKTI